MLFPLLFAIFVKIICLTICFFIVHMNSNGFRHKSTTIKDDNDDINYWFGYNLLVVSSVLFSLSILVLGVIFYNNHEDYLSSPKMFFYSMIYLFSWLLVISGFVEYQNNNITDEKFKHEEYIRLTNSIIFICSLTMGIIVGYLSTHVNIS